MDITDQLPRSKTWEELPKKYVHKGVWNGTMHTGFRNYEDLDTIVIHHSGPPEGTIHSHAGHHMRKWGAGIAYHLIIDKGIIYQTNDLRSFTFHTGNNNTYTIGICVNRDLRTADLTDEERRLLYAAILAVKAAIPSIKYIKGHKELHPSECPVTDVGIIRKDIADLEEKQHYVVATTDNQNLFNMLTRIRDLQQKLQDAQFAAEARRKLLIVHEAIEKAGFYK